MSVGVLHVRCGRGITRCLSDIVGRRVAQPAGISLGKVKNAPRNAGDLSGFPGDSWRASFAFVDGAASPSRFTVSGRHPARLGERGRGPIGRTEHETAGTPEHTGSPSAECVL